MVTANLNCEVGILGPVLLSQGVGLTFDADFFDLRIAPRLERRRTSQKVMFGTHTNNLFEILQRIRSAAEGSKMELQIKNGTDLFPPPPSS